MKTKTVGGHCEKIYLINLNELCRLWPSYVVAWNNLATLAESHQNRENLLR